MKNSLTEGNETKSILQFALPLIIGNIFQQLYNVADSAIVGKYIGPNALAAVSAAFALMVFLTSIIMGLCMGASVYFSELYGAKKQKEFKDAIGTAIIFIGIITIVLNIAIIIGIDPILGLMQIPDLIYADMREYTRIIFYGMFFVFLYNFFSSALRSVGNSKTPLIILVISALMNIVLDILFITTFDMGVGGAAWATVISQVFSAFASGICAVIQLPYIKGNIKDIRPKMSMVKTIASFSILSSIQQSIMNLGILMIQGLINSFGVVVMAGFGAAIKIEAFAYIPLQEYGNSFSTFVAQNIGAKKSDRIKTGIKSSIIIITIFGVITSIVVYLLAPRFMLIFLEKDQVETIKIGVEYLRITGLFYILIGYLFSFYGYFRAIGKPQVSIILTIISLGMRVALAYAVAPMFGTTGIWWTIPIGWLLADLMGAFLMWKNPITDNY